MSLQHEKSKERPHLSEVNGGYTNSVTSTRWVAVLTELFVARAFEIQTRADKSVRTMFKAIIIHRFPNLQLDVSSVPSVKVGSADCAAAHFC